MNLDESTALQEYINLQFGKIDQPNMDYMMQAGLLFPDRTPTIWNVLPDEWDKVMDERGMIGLEMTELEKYLEQWNRLLGHAYWVRGIYQARQETLTRTFDYVKDYIFTRASGGREQKAAVSGSHELTKQVLDRLTEVTSRLSEINGLVYRWEKIEFSITRAITVRSSRSY